MAQIKQPAATNKPPVTLHGDNGRPTASSSEKKGHVLMLAYTFPPVRKVSSRRLGYLYGRFTDLFERVTVFTSSVGAAMPTDPDLATDARPVVIPDRDLRYWLFGSRSQPTPESLPSEMKGRWWYRWLRKLRATFPFVLFFGDGSFSYQWRCYREAVRRVEAEGITHLFSSYPPWSGHFVAWALKRRFPHLHWIADFRDLSVDPSRNDVAFPRWHRRVEGWMLRRADRVWTVSEGLKKTLDTLHPRVEVVRNHLDRLPPAQTAPRSDRFTIAYTGTLYPGLSSPQGLFQAIRGLIDRGSIDPESIELQYYGPARPTWDQLVKKYSLGSINRSFDRVNHQRVLGVQSNAQLNLLLSWSHPDQSGVLTAKLYEYLTAGRPILAILRGPHDPELAHWIEGAGAGRLFSDLVTAYPAAMEKWVLALYEAWRENDGRLPWSIQADALGELLEPVARVLVE